MVIQDVQSDFTREGVEYLRDKPEGNKKRGYERNREIINEKLQEAVMWLENMKIFDKD